MKKPANLIEQYTNYKGQTVVIKNMDSNVLMNTYEYMKNLVRMRKHNIEYGVEITSGERGKTRKTIIRVANKEEELKHLNKEIALRDSLRFEAFNRKLLLR